MEGNNIVKMQIILIKLIMLCILKSLKISTKVNRSLNKLK